jgi:hypothetical protein
VNLKEKAMKNLPLSDAIRKAIAAVERIPLGAVQDDTPIHDVEGVVEVAVVHSGLTLGCHDADAIRTAADAQRLIFVL